METEKKQEEKQEVKGDLDPSLKYTNCKNCGYKCEYDLNLFAEYAHKLVYMFFQERFFHIVNYACTLIFDMATKITPTNVNTVPDIA